jgi:tRNA dimethylallyltransferase
VPHHLIDIRDPLQAYSAAEFVRDATRLMAEIQRARRAAAAGGRHHAVLQGAAGRHGRHARCRPRCARPARSRGRRDRLARLHAELARVDPVTAARLAPGDSQRIQRALEVWQATGKPLSSFHTIKTIADSASPISLEPFFPWSPTDRAWLHERIAQRFDAMLASGFVDEVRALRARGDLHADLPSMRCVGYRQVWEELDFQATRPEGTPLNTALLRERGIAATRQLAKRQITWLRGMPQRHTIACDRPTAVADLVHAVLARLDGRTP